MNKLTVLFFVPSIVKAATFQISLTVPPIRELELLPNNQVHIKCNTGEVLETSFDLGGVKYSLVNCDLSPGRYIDTVCDLQVDSK